MSDAVPRLHVEIDAELHRRAKIAAVERDETLKALVVEAVERLVDAHEAEVSRKGRKR
jgi:predicted HicB family RNase H-like nuclease